ncbi:MAG: fibronectin type III domain-containing protein [Paludibacteraceae bacterium]|nr:fibronectin type III domain-containing protein [Paludibacteraceae bacterium]
MTKKNTILVLFVLLAASLMGQTQTSYSCDFEDPNECAQWTLNVGAKGQTSKNKWYIGAAGSFGINSTKGLYMSCGTGADTLNSSYEARSFSCYQQTYRSISLARGVYTIQFDWLAMGQATDKIYVYYIDDAVLTASQWGSSTVALPLTKMPSDTIVCRGKSTWTSYVGQLNVTSNSGKLMIMWYNNVGYPATPAAAIDNIQIYQGAAPASPTNVTYDGNTASLKWRGNATSYDVMLYNINTSSVSEFANITQPQLTMPGLTEEGMYYFYVRAKGQNNHYSPWVFTSKFVWIKGARCIDIFDLTSNNSGAAKCYWTDNCTGDDYDVNMHDHAGQIDYGSGSETSRHTIHYIQGETDPRTEGKLKTIPDGEIASIRVNGFWESGGYHASCIEYDYPVQAGVSDLLVLKYACVLENPDHPEEAQPRFKLEVLNGNQVVDPCAQCDFKPGFGDAASWHHVNQGSYEQVDWCDWQTITVSLRNYIGSTLKIRLSAYDCTYSAHFGYAYFTLNCQGGDLQGIACGDFDTDHFDAPDGFNYRWYKASEPNKTLSTAQRFDIDRQDTTIYLVDMITKNKTQCYYTLEANPNPRFPQAKVLYDVQSKNCQNTVTFTNQSHVTVVNRQTGERRELQDAVETMYYDFGDGVFVDDLDKVITKQYPDEGGEFHVRAVAGMSSDVCQDTLDIYFTLPDLTVSDENDTLHVCGAEHTDSHGVIHYAADSAYYRDTMGTVVSQYGCELQRIRTVYFHPTYDTLYTVRICEGTKYTWPADGKVYTTTTKTTHNVPTMWGCDSIMRLDLTVDPALRVDYEDTVYACYDSAIVHIDYQILSGDIDSVFVFFPEQETQLGFDSVYKFVKGEPIAISLPNNPSLPGNHQAAIYFNGEFCSLDPIDFCVQVQYPASIVMMTDGFIGVQNALYNGGYQFADFVWYRNGQRLDNTQSYVPITKSDVGAIYTVRLRREGDNYTIESCPIQFHLWTGMQTIAADAPVEVYSLLGNYMGLYSSLQHAVHALPTGAYVMRDNNQLTQTVIVY